MILWSRHEVSFHQGEKAVPERVHRKSFDTTNYEMDDRVQTNISMG
jgi:hypothetical protein